MSPELARVVTLLAEIGADRAALSAHAERARKALATPGWQREDAVLSVAAVVLHHYYGAVESIFERIARAFEGLPDKSDRWHQDLLQRMALELEGVRPAVIGAATRQRLSELLSFRHFFRHAYAVTLDPAQLRQRTEELVDLHAALGEELDRFEAVLRQVADPGR